MTTIIRVTDQLSGMQYHYTSITACLEDVENPLEISQRWWSQIVKDKGYPFEHSGCKIDRIVALSTKDVREGDWEA